MSLILKSFTMKLYKNYQNNNLMKLCQNMNQNYKIISKGKLKIYLFKMEYVCIFQKIKLKKLFKKPMYNIIDRFHNK